jgi:general secretion pathway protein E
LEAIDELRTVYGRPVVVEESSLDDVHRIIERLTTRRDRLDELAGNGAVADDDDFASDVRDLANQPPVIRYVNLLMRDAHDASASDIHLEATRDGLAVRFRLDGVLVPAPEPPSGLQHAVVSRVKLLAELDIAERRRPQDGRIRVRLESRELDLRVSTAPTLFGESVVLRLLDRGGRPVRLVELGMPETVLHGVTALAGRAHGMLLVTGPTGSGKTTTLYAALQGRATGNEKIITVEDPVEYHLDGVTQVPVHRQAGVSFASALRSILRQDPDVVMIGEMRDPETAEIAIQAAMTGHLVFSTLHTNDAIGAIPRLLDLGIPDYLVSATLEGVLAQRLVRAICTACRETYTPDPARVAVLAGTSVAAATGIELTRGRGCAACRETGFRGRIGLFELLTLDDTMRDAVSRRASRAELRDLARASGMISLRDDGWQKVCAGITTVEEVLRVTEA